MKGAGNSLGQCQSQALEWSFSRSNHILLESEVQAWSLMSQIQVWLAISTFSIWAGKWETSTSLGPFICPLSEHQSQLEGREEGRLTGRKLLDCTRLPLHLAEAIAPNFQLLGLEIDSPIHSVFPWEILQGYPTIDEDKSNLIISVDTWW